MFSRMTGFNVKLVSRKMCGDVSFLWCATLVDVSEGTSSKQDVQELGIHGQGAVLEDSVKL